MAETEVLRSLANATLDSVNEEYLSKTYEILCAYNDAASQQSQFPTHLTPKYLHLLRAVLIDALQNTKEETVCGDMAEAIQLLSVFSVTGLRDASNVNFTQVLNQFVDTVFHYNRNKYYTATNIAKITDLNGPTSRAWASLQFLVVAGRHLDACNLISTLLTNLGTIDALKTETSLSYTSQIINDLESNLNEHLDSRNLRELLVLRLGGGEIELSEVALQNQPTSHFHLRYLLNLLTEYPVDKGIVAFNAWRTGVLAWERVLVVEAEMLRLQVEEGVKFEKRVVHDEDPTLFQQSPETLLNYMNELYKTQREIIAGSGHEVLSKEKTHTKASTTNNTSATNTHDKTSISSQSIDDNKGQSENKHILDCYRHLFDICQILLGKNVHPQNNYYRYAWWSHMTMLYFYTEPRESAVDSHFTESLRAHPKLSTSLATWEIGAQALFKGSFVSALNSMHQIDLPQATVLAQMLDYGGKLELYGKSAQFVVDELSVEFATICTSSSVLLGSGLDILVGMSRSPLARKWATTLLPLLLRKDPSNVMLFASCADKMGISPLDNQILFAGAKIFRNYSDYASAVKVYDLLKSYKCIYEMVWELFQNLLTEREIYEIEIKHTSLAQFISGVSEYSSTSSSHVLNAQVLAARLCDIIVSVQVRDAQNIKDCMLALLQFPEPPFSVVPLLVAFICGQTDLVINRDLADISLTMLGRDQQVAETPSSDWILKRGIKQQQGGTSCDLDMNSHMLINSLKRELMKRIELV